ncbi:MAG: DUF2911 domain-containing protein [Bacteroidota bacterium]|nr:DUF2911 domain-containing protein [Bacteroidota bacterium]
MKKKNLSKGIFMTFVCLLMTSFVWAQGDKSKRPSPPEMATGKIKDATITINYSSPAVKGRKIWGDLVPYDKVWRAGANEATLFQTDKNIMIEGKSLPAGKYSLYAIPGKTEWVIVLNSQTGQWGIKMDGGTTEDPAKDVLKVTVKPVKSTSFNERLKFEVDKKGFALEWENLKVPVSVK